MRSSWTRREFLTRAGVAVAAVQTFENLDPCCVFAADAETADQDLFELKPVADGVYAAIAAPRYKVNSNAAVILTNDGVIVVDSHSKPSAAYALYREIQGITKQPIRKIINTHFHWDHWQGNQVYAEAFPDLEIITSERTRENLVSPSAGSGGVAFIEKQLTSVPKEIEKLKDDIARVKRRRAEGPARSQPAPDAGVSRRAERAQAGAADAHAVGLDHAHEGGREIEILQLGRGHTDGDVFIYLPKEKVVATGDALIDWMPFMNDGYPEDWIQTLNALEKFDFTRVIPGHGEVRPGTISPSSVAT